MAEPVGSTTWHHRHLDSFVRLGELLRAEGPASPIVLIIGPGAVTPPAALLLNDAAARPGRLRKLIGDAARYGDQLLRRVPWIPLISLEPAEVQAALQVPHRLVVADRSQRILTAVRRRLPAAECHCVDICFQPVPLQADAVIAFNVVCRLEDPAAGMARVAEAVRPGGFLLIDDRSAEAHLRRLAGFTPLGTKIHRRQAR